MKPPEVVNDPCTGRPILVAPHRVGRPLYTVPEHDHGPCPFCAGQEHSTPPERDAIRDAGSAPDGPGWRVRAFENRYPAAEWHEVIAEGAEHHTQPGALEPDLWRDVLTIWRRRMRHLEAQPGVATTFLFKNVGREAGASIAHNHSQLLGLPMLPPRVCSELEHARRDGCEICRQLDGAAEQERMIVAGRHHSVLSPRTPKLPFETWLVPHDHTDDLLDDAHTEDLADVLCRLFRAVDRAFGAPPFNTWVHRVPGEDFHWHLELQPRTGYLAALELGGDMYINAVTPRESARRLSVEPG